jgi:hypothetical protein
VVANEITAFSWRFLSFLTGSASHQPPSRSLGSPCMDSRRHHRYEDTKPHDPRQQPQQHWQLGE